MKRLQQTMCKTSIRCIKSLDFHEETIDNKIIAAYKERKESIYISMIWPIFANILIVAVLTGLIWLLVNAITTGATAYIPVS